MFALFRARAWGERGVSLAVWIVALVICVPAAQAASEFRYTREGGAITITGYVLLDPDVTIPTSIEGLPVTRIGDGAFQFAPLTSVTLPTSVTTIGHGAFSFCSGLTSLIVDPSNPSYRSVDGVLFDKALTSLIQCPGGKRGAYTLPNSVITIGHWAFSYCTGLTSLTLPNSVITIGHWAFSYCTGLTSLTLPNSVATIGDGAFFRCSGLTSLTLPNSVTTIGDRAFYYCSGLTSVTLPNSLTTIGDRAFSYCTGLTSLTLPNSVTTIGHGAFSGCTGLTSLTLPNSVTTIGYWAFYYCTGLTSLIVDPSNPSYRSVDGVLFDKALTSLLQCPGGKRGAYTLPNSVTAIGEYAFSFCSGLTSVTLPNSVTTIGDRAFYYCSGLTSVTLPNSVATIGNEAFSGCSGLTSVTLPNSLTTIGYYAFSGCSGLASVTLPNSLTTIGDWAFYGCTGLTSLTLPNSVATIGNSAFYGCTGLASVYFQGNAPFHAGDSIFAGSPATIYYLPGTLHWGATFAGRPTALWALPAPVILTSRPGPRRVDNRFVFTISWAGNSAVVVEASADLAHPVWTRLETKPLSGGTAEFSDPDWQSHPVRFYRLAAP